MKAGFKAYQSKPIERIAHQLTEKEVAKLCCTGDRASVMVEGEPLIFAYHCAPSEIVAGDWVVFLNEEDTYHCTDGVFRERNHVPEEA